jgi:hypothetical protein
LRPVRSASPMHKPIRSRKKFSFFWNSDTMMLKPIPKQTLHKFIMFILQHCTFEFNQHFYSQLFGTTMGAKFSVKFANIYMHKWLDKFVTAYTGFKPGFIARLIDDCFFLWNHGVDELNKFVTYLNSCHDSIKFEVNFSVDKVCFLDTVTSIIDNVIHTNVYTKPTDKKQYLFFSSSHPKHTTKAIPYSQALRYRRIIDDDHLLYAELTNLNKAFLIRGYPLELLNHTVERIRLITRDAALQYKDKSVKNSVFLNFLKDKSFLPLILPFHQSLERHIEDHITKFWPILLNSDTKTKSIFENERPQVVFKRGITLGNLLTSTRCHIANEDVDSETTDILKSLERENYAFKVTPCKRPLCKCCDHIQSTSAFYDIDRTRCFSIADTFNCNSKDVIYVISCLKCNKLYVGQTARMIKDRLNNHRSDIKLNKPTAIGLHFNELCHSLKHLIITPIADISNLSISDKHNVELEFMTLLRTRYPLGLNCYPIVN